MRALLVLLLTALAAGLPLVGLLVCTAQPTPSWRREYPGYAATPTSILFTPDSRYLLLDLRRADDVSAAELRCLSIGSWEELWRFSYVRGSVQPGVALPSCVAVSGEMGYVLAAGMGVHVLSLESGSEISVLSGGKLVTHFLLGGGRYLVISCAQQGIYSADLTTMSLQALLTGPTPLMPMAIAEDGRFLAVEYAGMSGGQRGPRLVCFSFKGSELWSFEPKVSWPSYYVAVGGALPDFSRIMVRAFSAAGESVVYVLDSNGIIVAQRSDFPCSPLLALMSYDGSRILLQCSNALWGLSPELKELWKVDIRVGKRGLNLVGDPYLNRILVPDPARSTLLVIDGKTGQVLGKLPINVDNVITAAISIDGQHIALLLTTNTGVELQVYRASELSTETPPGPAQPPPTQPPAPEVARFRADWSSLERWAVYPGWWGSVGTVELSSNIYVSPPYSLHLRSSRAEAAYVYCKAPEIDFLSPYNVTLYLYLSGDCDGISVYQDANIKLAIIDGELRVLESRQPLRWKPVARLEKNTRYKVVMVVDPVGHTAVVSVAGVTVEASLPLGGLSTSVETPEGTVEWDVIIGDLSHSGGLCDLYMDDLEIAQAAGAPGGGAGPSPPPAGKFEYKVKMDKYSVKVEKGKPAVFKVYVMLVSGTPGEVKLSLVKLGGFPADFPYRFEPPVVVPPATSTLYIDTSEMEGARTLILVAKSGAKEVAVMFSLKVTVPFDFNIALEPTEVEAVQGETVAVTIRVELVKGKAEPVKLKVSGLPGGAGYSLTPNVVTPSGTAKLTISVGDVKGEFNVTIEGSSNGKVKAKALRLRVKEEKRCVIATATYGSELSGVVDFLRSFRDGFILKTYAGRRFYIAFDAFYYSWSPAVASTIEKSPQLKLAMRLILYPLVLSLQAAALAAKPLTPINPEVAAFVAGAVASALIGVVYASPFAYAVLRRRKVEKLARYLSCALSASILTSVAAEILRVDIALTLATSAYVLLILATSAALAAAVVRKALRS